MIMPERKAETSDCVPGRQVTAWLLKQAGHNVFGIHMRNWDEEEEKGTHSEVLISLLSVCLCKRARESACIKMCVGQVSGHCSSAGDLKDAVATCKHLDIPLKQVNTRIFLTLSPHDTFSDAR